MSETALAIWSSEELTIIRSVIAPTLDDAELRFFAQVCKATGLNPLMNQIVAIKRNDRNAPGGKKLTIQTTIHGLRLIADRTGRYAPGPLTTFEMRADGKTPDSATAYVRKFAGGVWHEVSDVAYWDEYVQTYNGEPSNLWRTKPRVMLAKCAEALTLRRAFPAEMAGLYVDEEMPAITVSEVSAAAHAPIAPLPATNLAPRPEPTNLATHGVMYEQAKGSERAPAEPAAVATAAALWKRACDVALDYGITPGNMESAVRDLYGKPPGDVTRDELTALVTAIKASLLTHRGNEGWVIDQPPAAKGDADLPLGLVGEIAAAVR